MHKRLIIFILAAVSLIMVAPGTAQDDATFTTAVNTAIMVDLPLPDGMVEPVTVLIDRAPTAGVLTGSAASYRYTPNEGFTGEDRIVYTVIGSDGRFVTGTITIRVLAEDEAVASGALPQAFNATYDTQVRTQSAVPVDITLAYGTNYEITRTPQNGTLSGQVPRLTYTPDASFSGRDRFSYAVVIDDQTQTIDVDISVQPNQDLTPERSGRLTALSSAREQGLPGLTPELAAVAQPGINDSLSRFSANNGNVSDLTYGDTIEVIVNSRNVATAERAIRGNGGRVMTITGNQIVARVPTAQLIGLGRNDAVANVRLPEPALPLSGTGVIVSEGVATMGADVWQANGYDGSGVKIGVIDYGYYGFSNDAAVEVDCNVTPPYDMSTEATYIEPTNRTLNNFHGTAVVELLCDTAPSANIYPVHVFYESEFVNAIDYLINTHDVDIITVSLAWAKTAGDGVTHVTSAAVNQAVADHDVLFVIATGNNYLGHYEGRYSPFDVDPDETPGTGDEYTTHDFQETQDSGGDWGNTINGSNAIGFEITAGTQLNFSLVWEDDWANVANDFDFYLMYYEEDPNGDQDTNDARWIEVARSAKDNIANNFVGEQITYTVPDDPEDKKDGWYRLLIQDWDVTGNPWLQIYEVNEGQTLEYTYPYSSIFDPAASPSAFSVSAYYWDDMTQIEIYSARGPVNTVGGGAPLPDGAFQPQAAAPTGGDTAIAPSGLFGTSGAAPHAAGAAALVWSANPDWTRTQVMNFLRNRAADNDRGDDGPDYTYGHGLLTLGALPGDNPIGIDTIAIYRDSDRSWYLKNENIDGDAELVFPYGDPADQAVVGDWNGDGVDSVGIFREGVFYLKNSNADGAADLVFEFGEPTDLPVAGDWDGDGVDSVGVYRPAAGTWYLTNSLDAPTPELAFTYGLTNETPIAGDWDGDGVDTIGIFRASDRSWYLRNSNTDGNAEIVFVYGDPELDTPVVGDWDGDGVDTVGIYRFGDGVWYLRNSNTEGDAEIVFPYGLTNEVPVIGNWDGQ
jgi:subtilisin family serine protease